MDHFSCNLCNLMSKKRRDGIADLTILLGAWTLEKVIVRKRLESCRFSNRQASALMRIRMDEGMSVL